MKVAQVITKELPWIATNTHGKTFHHVILFETNAGFYQVMEVLSQNNPMNEVQLLRAYEHGARVTVKRAVELFGSGISEKMDWSDE